MSERVIMTNYIYLLQVREFIKTKENVYKNRDKSERFDIIISNDM